jgi:hypothetical protein
LLKTWCKGDVSLATLRRFHVEFATEAIVIGKKEPQEKQKFQ